MAIPGPVPQIGQQEAVIVNGFPLNVVPGSYARNPAKRFGDKVSTGDLRYQDFNPYESAASYSSLEKGFGLRRFSDLPETENPEGYYAESNNVDCRAPGIPISPACVAIDIPLNNGGTRGELPVWFGEWTPTVGSVTGTRWVMLTSTAIGSNGIRAYYFSTSTTAVNSGYLVGTGISGSFSSAIAVGGQLIIGFGSRATAVYITTLDASVGAGNVQDTATNNLFVFASSADRASIYISGGTAATNTNTVLSAAVTAVNPAQSFAVAASAITCGTGTINGLLSGGGLGGILVFVGKSNEIGFIDTSAVYHVLMPFEQSLSTNCSQMAWFLPGSDKSDVGQMLVFNLGRSLWSYTTGGQPMNLSPEGKAGFRPINARGIVTCIQPTTHYLYYGIQSAIRNGQQPGYIIAFDGVSGANHTYRYNGSGVASGNVPFGGNPQCMGVTSLFGSNPLLYIGSVPPGSNDNTHINVGVITLPADGDYPPADANCRYDTTLFNTLLLPDIDYGFPDEDKVATYLRIVADNLASGAQYITASYAVDGSSTYTTLGTFFVSPIQDIPFPSLVYKRISIQLNFVTNNTTKTPILNAVSMRSSINAKVYTVWSMKCTIPTGATMLGPDSPYNANTVINNFWAAYKAGTPVPYTDRWNKQWLVRLLDFDEPETTEEQLRTPNTVIDLQLLELYGTGLESSWDGVSTIWDSPQMTWG